MKSVRLPSGAASRSRVCGICRLDSFKRQATAAKATKRAKLEQQVLVCRHCYCPLMLLRSSNGKQERRRVCAQCKEREALPESKQRRQEQIKSWKQANMTRIREAAAAWQAAHKDKVAGYRRKLLIEDVSLVRRVTTAYRNRQSRRNRSTADDV